MGKYDSRRKVYVTPFLNSPLRYGFLTNIDEAQGTLLGHTDISGGVPPGYIFGANAPKPARASKRFVTGTVSSYISASAIATARQQGWRIGKGRRRLGGVGAKSATVYVSIDGVKYAWNMPNDTRTNIGGDLAGLGIKLADAIDTDLVFGASSPKPPRAYKDVGAGDSMNRISTFYDPSITPPEPWKPVGNDVDPEA